MYLKPESNTMPFSRKLPVAALIAVTALTQTTLVFGQSPATKDASSTDATDPTDAVIIVTARKRDERISDVSATITSVTGDQLRRQGVNSVQDLSSVAAGVVLREDVAGRASPSIVIRGIGYDDFRSNGNPAAAVSADQVYLGSNALIGGAFFDVDRLEILKGPQGTLYGRNTTAGAVNVISRQPGNAFSADAHLEYGSHRRLRAEVGVGGPINQVLGVRVAAVQARGGGFMTNKGTQGFAGVSPATGVPPLPLVPESNHVGDADFSAQRATLVITPSTTTRITAQLNHARDRGDNSQSDVLGVSATGFKEPDTDPYTFYANLLPKIDSKQSGGHLRIDQQISGDLSLTAIAARVELDRGYTFDPGDPRRRFDLDYNDRIRQSTAEIRLHGKRSAVDWTVGAFYFQDSVLLKSTLDASDLVRTVLGTDYEQRRSSWAVFGETDWHLTPKTTLTAGLRYTDETASFRGKTVDRNPYGVSVASSAFALPVQFDESFADNSVSGRVSLSYRPDNGSLIYGTYSRGFKSGGFDGSTIFSRGEALPFKSETVDALELGIKLFGRGKPFSLSAAAFHYDFSNLQANSIRQIGSVTTAVRTNVAQATMNGAEIDLVAYPVRDARIGLNVAYLQSKVDNFVSANALEVARRNGNELPDAPGLSANLNASYTVRLGNGWKLEPQVNISFVGKHWKEIDNFVEVDDRTLLGVRMALTPPDGSWTLAAFGRNITDQKYFTGLIPAVTSAGVVTGQQRIVGAPASWGLSFDWRF
jgi:iron complex outermembrane receptor protein